MGVLEGGFPPLGGLVGLPPLGGLPPPEGGLPPLGLILSPSSRSLGNPSIIAMVNGSIVVRAGRISPVSGSKSTIDGGLVAKGASVSSFVGGMSVVMVAAISSFSNSIVPSTVVNCFFTKIATHRPYNSSNCKVSVISAITIPANRIAPMNFTKMSPPCSINPLQSVLPSTRYIVGRYSTSILFPS